MGRPKKASKVAEQLHVGMRFPPDLGEMAQALLDEANGYLASQGLPPTVTLSGMVKAWVGERLTEEYAKLLQRQAAKETENKGPSVHSREHPLRRVRVEDARLDD